MEVKPGYKHTEVGVIPEDWDLDYIENLANITTGAGTLKIASMMVSTHSSCAHRQLNTSTAIPSTARLS